MTPDFKFELWLSEESIRYICATVCISVIAVVALLVLLFNGNKGDKDER